jgi:hypothetical protein
VISTTCGGTRSSTMPVTNVRLKSGNVHGGMTARPSSRAAASIAASRRPFIRLQPDTGVVPVVVKTRLLGFALTLAISSRTSGGSGTTCARPFFVLLPGMFQEAALGFIGFTITMVAQTQEPSGLQPVPRLLPGVLVDDVMRVTGLSVR